MSNRFCPSFGTLHQFKLALAGFVPTEGRFGLESRVARGCQYQCAVPAYAINLVIVICVWHVRNWCNLGNKYTYQGIFPLVWMVIDVNRGWLNVVVLSEYITLRWPALNLLKSVNESLHFLSPASPLSNPLIYGPQIPKEVLCFMTICKVIQQADAYVKY